MLAWRVIARRLRVSFTITFAMFILNFKHLL